MDEDVALYSLCALNVNFPFNKFVNQLQTVFGHCLSSIHHTCGGTLYT